MNKIKIAIGMIIVLNMIFCTAFESAYAKQQKINPYLEPEGPFGPFTENPEKPEEYPSSFPLKVWVDDNWVGSSYGQKVGPGKIFGITAFDKIQDGVDAVANNGKVSVFNGTYLENIIINKSIDVTGEDKKYTILDGEGLGNVFTILSKNIVISGFTIQAGSNGNSGVFIDSNNNEISNNIIQWNTMGVHIQNSMNNTIEDNDFNNNSGALEISNSDNNMITDNSFYKNTASVLIVDNSNNNQILNNKINFSDATIGIELNSNHNIIQNNIINNTNLISISISQGSNYNVISDNIILQNGEICFWVVNGASNNTISHNVLTGKKFSDSVYGMFIATNFNKINDNYITDFQTGIFFNGYYNLIFNNIISYNNLGCSNNLNFVHGNKFYHNSFIENNINVEDAGNNQWNSSYPFGGNYFSDYTGVDLYQGPHQNITGSDGIGDTPHNILGLGNNKDYFPLMVVWNNSIILVDDDFNPSTPGWNDTHFDKIQNGINACRINGTIYVYPGYYNENIIVNKSVKIIGENKETTIVDANYVDSNFLLVSDNITISGFMIKRCGQNYHYPAGIYIESNGNNISDNKIIENEYAIRAKSSKNNKFSNNLFIDNNHPILFINPELSINNKIINNIFKENENPIQIGTSYSEISNNNFINNSVGLLLFDDDTIYNIVENNIISENNNSGIMMYNCYNNYIRDNEIEFNGGNGLDLTNAKQNIIHNNVINSNGDCAIRLDHSSDSNTITENNITNNNKGIRIVNTLDQLSINNYIYHNNFISNINFNAYDECLNNNWDNGIDEGNYWDDFESNPGYPDVYEIPGGDNVDNYPLMEPYIW